VKIPQIFAESGIPDSATMPRVPTPPSVNMDALPRALPIPGMDISGETALNNSLAQSGHALAQLGAGTLNQFNAAQQRRQDAKDHLDGVERFNAAKGVMDDIVADLEKAPDAEGHRGRVESAWVKLQEDTLKGAKSERAQFYLGENFARLRLEVMQGARTFEDKRFTEHGQAVLVQTMDRLQRGAVDATREEDVQYYRDRIKDELVGKDSGAVRRGLMKEPDAHKELLRRESTIHMQRASNEAYRSPAAVSDKLGRGAYDSYLDDTQRTNLEARVNNRMQQLRNEQQNRDAQDRRETEAKQTEVAFGWRKAIQENYRPGGAGKDLEPDITEGARALGEQHYKEIVADHRARREHFLKPPVKKTSDPEVVANYQYWITTEKFDLVSQDGLRSAFRANQLDEADYTRFSNQLESKRSEVRARSEKGQNEQERDRAKVIKDGDDLIETFLRRGNDFQWSLEGQKTRVIAVETVNEYHRRLSLDPKADPRKLAQELIEDRIAEVENMKEGLPYQTRDEVTAAFLAGTIDKSRADFYYRIIGFVEMRNPKKKPPSSDLRKPTP